MSIEPANLLAIAVMALVTYATRIGGVLGMSFFSVTPRIEAFLKWLGSSVIVALLASAVMSGTPRTALVALAATVAMVLTGRTLLAMILGVAVSAFAVQLGL